MKCAANKKRRVTLACVAHGITLLAKSRIRRSGRSSPLPYPPLRLKASSWYHAMLILSMYNLCGRIVQFERRGCSTIAVALFNSKRSGCSTTAEYSVWVVSVIRKNLNTWLVVKFFDSRSTSRTSTLPVFTLTNNRIMLLDRFYNEVSKFCRLWKIGIIRQPVILKNSISISWIST